MSVPSPYQQPLKRARVVRACEQCRTRKVKCNGEDPCLTCWQHNQACRYGEMPLGRGRSSKKPVIGKCPNVTDGTSTATFILNGDLSGRDLPRAKGSNFQETARYSPEEYRHQLELRAGIGVANSQTGSFQFYGPSSHFCFIQRLYQRMKRQPHGCLLDKPKTAVPAGLGEWGLERFMFAAGSGAPRSSSASTEIFLPKDLGDRFIAAYFAIIHPHMPVLDHLVINRLWGRLWEAPSAGQEVISRHLVYMVLALGARTMAREGSHSAELLDRWADHFWSQSNDYGMLFQEPCLKGVHFLLLKAMYALHGMRPNDAYLYLGHAARSVLALGLNRGQVANGTGPVMQKLRITFWMVYSYERICAFFTGRPSGFIDSHIDVSFPEDLLSCNRQTLRDEPITSPDGPLTECAYLRAVAQIGQLIEKVSSGIFSSSNLHTIYDSRKLNNTIIDCDAALDQIERSLPSYLQFFNPSRPKSDVWREIQCTHLGLAFHLIRMMTRRPAMVYYSLIRSEQSHTTESFDVKSLQASIDLSILSAKEIINIASSAIMERATCIRNDASVANYIMSACVTLLYDVLDTSVTVQHALDVFTSVERGIQCLDRMEHHGPITGKALSLDIMKCAKDALSLSSCEVNLEQNLADSFPWLNDEYLSARPEELFNPLEEPIDYASEIPPQPFQQLAGGNDFLSASISGVNYMSYWLRGNATVPDVSDYLY